ncbi:myb/SANT-like DNA-binding domain-containing protein 3 [Cephus cinctus]|uniref:Regulatory protein zeste n=1 Tax=Cephus cinctus TaxID=211228 RepID=A0AAJ7BIM0_CEPCN|nr:myb/SANT-like DNA-binding domain-containing protein 3 [Cephus cinctus]
MGRTKKKKRTSNFIEEEKFMLVDLITEKKHIIENKGTNSAIIKEKEKCWEEITNKFNSASTFTYRDTQALRNCWDNIKKRTRKYFAERRREVLKTAESKIALNEILAKDETEKHSIELAIAEKKLICEKLQIDILKTELEIKKTILIREKTKNAMLGILNETE